MGTNGAVTVLSKSITPYQFSSEGMIKAANRAAPQHHYRVAERDIFVIKTLGRGASSVVGLRGAALLAGRRRGAEAARSRLPREPGCARRGAGSSECPLAAHRHPPHPPMAGFQGLPHPREPLRGPEKDQHTAKGLRVGHWTARQRGTPPAARPSAGAAVGPCPRAALPTPSTGPCAAPPAFWMPERQPPSPPPPLHSSVPPQETRTQMMNDVKALCDAPNVPGLINFYGAYHVRRAPRTPRDTNPPAARGRLPVGERHPRARWRARPSRGPRTRPAHTITPPHPTPRFPAAARSALSWSTWTAAASRTC